MSWPVAIAADQVGGHGPSGLQYDDNGRVIEKPAKPFDRYEPDDPKVLKRLFDLDV